MAQCLDVTRFDKQHVLILGCRVEITTIPSQGLAVINADYIVARIALQELLVTARGFLVVSAPRMDECKVIKKMLVVWRVYQCVIERILGILEAVRMSECHAILIPGCGRVQVGIRNALKLDE